MFKYVYNSLNIKEPLWINRKIAHKWLMGFFDWSNAIIFNNLWWIFGTWFNQRPLDKGERLVTKTYRKAEETNKNLHLVFVYLWNGLQMIPRVVVKTGYMFKAEGVRWNGHRLAFLRNRFSNPKNTEGIRCLPPVHPCSRANEIFFACFKVFSLIYTAVFGLTFWCGLPLLIAQDLNFLMSLRF